METVLKEATKVCKGCGRELPLGAFGKHRLAQDGHMNECNECRRRAAQKNTNGNPLAKFTARQLMNELFSRGYRGELKYTQVHTITLGRE